MRLSKKGGNDHVKRDLFVLLHPNNWKISEVWMRGDFKNYFKNFKI